MSAEPVEGTVSRDDIEAKFREIKGEVSAAGDRAKVPAMAIGAVVVVGLVGLAFVIGRRRGRKATTVVEVRRV
jgi:hypothetical protein